MRFLFIFLGTAGDSLLHGIIICHSPPMIKTGAVPFYMREPGGTINVMTPT